MTIPLPPSVDELPPNPNRSTPRPEFVLIADAWNAAFPGFRTQLLALADYVYQRALSIYAWTASASESSTQATNAAQAAQLSKTQAANSASTAQTFAELATTGSALPSFSEQHDKTLTVDFDGENYFLTWRYLQPRLEIIPDGQFTVSAAPMRHYVIKDPNAPCLIQMPSVARTNDTIVISVLNNRYDNVIDMGGSKITTAIGSLTGQVQLDTLSAFLTFRYLNSSEGWIL